MTTTGPRPLIDIFPPGLDIHSKSTTSRGHFNFAPEQLYHRLTDTYLPEHHIESTIVKSVWYGKQKRSARHEFILNQVEEIRTELKNYMVLDRNLNEAVAPTGKSIVPAASSRCCRSAALDAFRVSYDGIEKQQVSSTMATTGPRRLIDVFPPGFDINSKSSSSRGHYHFAPEQLYLRLTDEYLPEKHIESTIVKSVWYGKQRKSARHEFILIEVEDTHAEMKNYIVLDRNLNEAVAPIGKNIVPARVASSSRCCRGAALDAFRVSYDGIEKQLLRECELWPRDYLERIDFGPTEPFFLYQLATLVYVVSDKSPNYVVADRNCYWFAGLIWECTRHLRPNAAYDDRLAKNRGKFSILRYKPEAQERDAICDTFNNEIMLVEARLSESRKVCRLGLTRLFPISWSPALEQVKEVERTYRAHVPWVPGSRSTGLIRAKYPRRALFVSRQ
ncbi:hypothetical protein RSAG8_08915, partial [Rhizoctonia solani AG-8 WAC10335]